MNYFYNGFYKTIPMVLVLTFLVSCSGYLTEDIQKDQRNSVFDEAEINHLSGDLEKAIELYRKFIINFPNSPLVWDAKLRIAQCSYGLGNFDLALRNVEDILKYSQHRSLRQEILGGAYFVKANILFDRNLFAEAEDTYKSALMYPEGFYQKHDVLFNLFKCLYRRGKWVESLSIINELVDKYPQSPGANFFYKYKRLINSGKFFIQAGVFAQESNAQNFSVKLNRDNFATDVEKINIDGTDYFVVFVGPYNSWIEAVIHNDDLKNLGFNTIIIP